MGGIMSDIIVVAGTADARKIIERLTKLNIEVAATVTTKFGNELLNEYDGVKVFEGKLDSKGMEALITHTGVKCLVDASHPFAREASINAIAACKSTGIPYLRFERENAGLNGMDVSKVKSFEEAADLADKIDGNIFLATGSNTVEIFVNRISNYKDRLSVRVLPDSKVLLKCEQAGLSAKNIIAVKGPFSEEMNVEMLKHCNAKVMISKDSGETGGTLEKLSAAHKLGVRVILVERPEVDYIRSVSSVEEVVGFVTGIAKEQG